MNEAAKPPGGGPAGNCPPCKSDLVGPDTAAPQVRRYELRTLVSRLAALGYSSRDQGDPEVDPRTLGGKSLSTAWAQVIQAARRCQAQTPRHAAPPDPSPRALTRFGGTDSLCTPGPLSAPAHARHPPGHHRAHQGGHRHRRGRLGARPAPSAGPQLAGAVPVSQREHPLLQRQSRAADLSLLRLRRRRRRLQVPSGDRQGLLPRGRHLPRRARRDLAAPVRRRRGRRRAQRPALPRQRACGEVLPVHAAPSRGRGGAALPAPPRGHRRDRRGLPPRLCPGGVDPLSRHGDEAQEGLPRRGAGAGRPRPAGPLRPRPLRPLPGPRRLSDHQPVGAHHRLRGAGPARRRRAEVPQLSGDPHLPQERRALRDGRRTGVDPPPPHGAGGRGVHGRRRPGAARRHPRRRLLRDLPDAGPRAPAGALRRARRPALRRRRRRGHGGRARRGGAPRDGARHPYRHPPGRSGPRQLRPPGEGRRGPGGAGRVGPAPPSTSTWTAWRRPST